MKNLLSGKILNAILEDLNLKKDEEFGIKEYDGKFRINNHGLELFI